MEETQENKEAIIEQPKQENKEMVVQQPKQEEKEVAVVAVKEEQPATIENLNDKYLKKQIEEGANIKDIAADFAKAKSTSEIINDNRGEYKKFNKELAEEQKETLKESFKADKVGAQTRTLTEKQKKAEAFYVSFRPILEFDFSQLVHKNLSDENKSPKTYKDRSYGIPLMCLMLFLFVVPYCLFSIILAIFNGVNAVFEAIATFGKVARTIAMSIFILILLSLIVYCALLGIDAVFGTSIIENLRF